MTSSTATATSKQLRIGILGCANISKKTIIAISNSVHSDCVVTAIASRSVEKAQQFVTELFPEARVDDVKIFGGITGYSDLIDSTEEDIVDAIYIPLPTSIKKEWVLKALRQGKHVVVEKPTAMCLHDLQEFYTQAYKQNKFFLDGTMFPHHVRTKQILNTISTNIGTITSKIYLGDVNRIECNFTFLADNAFLNEGNNIRSRNKQMGGDPYGCIGDLGWYCIRYGLMVYEALYNITHVVSVQVVNFELNKFGVPVDATCHVKFERNKVLWFHCSFIVPYRQHFEICGNRRSLIVDDLVLPSDKPNTYTLKSSGLTKYDLITYHETEVVQCDNEDAPVQEVLLWKNFAKYARAVDKINIKSNCTDTSTKWVAGDRVDSNDNIIVNEANESASIIMRNQRIVDGLMESIENECAVINFC